MSFGSKLWSSRAHGETPDDGKPSGGPRGVLARLLGNAQSPRATIGAKAATQELLFDSFASKSERELSHTCEVLEEHPASDPENLRQAERFTPIQPSTTLVDSKGKRHRARIINFSSTGVAVEADFTAVPPESVTHVGAMRVVTGRPMRSGMVYLFEKPLDPARCGPTTVL